MKNEQLQQKIIEKCGGEEQFKSFLPDILCFGADFLWSTNPFYIDLDQFYKDNLVEIMAVCYSQPDDFFEYINLSSVIRKRKITLTNKEILCIFSSTENVSIDSIDSILRHDIIFVVTAFVYESICVQYNNINKVVCPFTFTPIKE